MEELYEKLKPEFKDNLIGIVMYGSRVTNCAKEDSDWDAIAVTESVMKCDEPLVHRVLNVVGPNFYSRHIDDKLVSLCVTDMKYMRREFMWRKNYLTGRLQKPVMVFAGDQEKKKTLDGHIDRCRKKGAYQTLALLEEKFTMDDFLEGIVGLSYKMDFRPNESKKILVNARDMLEETYIPYLEWLEECEKITRDEDTFVNFMGKNEKRMVWANIYYNKFNSLFMNFKGVLTYDGLAEEAVRKARRIMQRKKELKS